eukprot:g30297.t1
MHVSSKGPFGVGILDNLQQIRGAPSAVTWFSNFSTKRSHNQLQGGKYLFGCGIRLQMAEVVENDKLDAEIVGDGDGEVQEVGRGNGDGPGEFEVGVKGVDKVDELFKLLMRAQGNADIVINVVEEE